MNFLNEVSNKKNKSLVRFELSIFTPRVKYLDQLHKSAASNFKQLMEATPHKGTAAQPPTLHHENSKR